MNKYKITYWNNGNIKVAHVEAKNENDAKYSFYMHTPCDDIKSIEEVTEDVE